MDTRSKLKNNRVITILLLCSVGVIVFAITRSNNPPQDKSNAASDSPPQQTKIDTVIQPLPSLAPFAIPDRPTFIVEESKVSQEIARLRSESFSMAENTVRRLKDNPAAISLLGKVHLRHGNTDVALKIWNYALTIAPNFSDALLDMGNAASILGNQEQAELYFRNSIKSAKDPTDAQFALGKLLIEDGRLNEAIEQLSPIVKRNVRRTDVWCKLGIAHQQMGNFSKAIESYSKAVQIDGNSWEAILGLQTAYRSLGDSGNAMMYTQLLENPNRNRADRVNEESTSVDEAKSIWYFEFISQAAADIYLQAGNVSGATDTLVKAIQVVPDSGDIRRMLLSLYAKQGRETAAIELLQSRCDKSSDPFSSNIELGVFCMKIRRLDIAEKAIQKAILLSPNQSEGYSLLSQIQMTKPNEAQLAVESAKRALKLSPLASNHYILATAMYHAKDMAGARRELNEAVKMEPGNSEFRDALARLPNEVRPN